MRIVFLAIDKEVIISTLDSTLSEIKLLSSPKRQKEGVAVMIFQPALKDRYIPYARMY